MTQHAILSTIDSLYILQSSCVSPEVGGLARRAGLTPTAVAEALLHLEKRGLVDGSGVRLTMPGLVAAAALHAHAFSVRTAA